MVERAAGRLSLEQGTTWLPGPGLDGRVLMFSIAAATINRAPLRTRAGVARIAWVDPQTAMKPSTRRGAGRNRFTLGRALVRGQVALSLVLVVTAGLLMGSFQKLVRWSRVPPRGVLLVSMNLASKTEGQERRAVHPKCSSAARSSPASRPSRPRSRRRSVARRGTTSLRFRAMPRRPAATRP